MRRSFVAAVVTVVTLSACSVPAEQLSCGNPSFEEIQAAASPSDAGWISRQVLGTTVTVPAGTPVDDLIQAPTTMLTALAVPGPICDTVITTVARLQTHGGEVVAVDIQPGALLDERHLINAR